MEAMASGLPVITTPAGDSDTVVIDGKTGYVVPFEDNELMADRMLTLFNSAELRQSMGEAGRRRVESVYSSVALANNLLAIYQDIASKKRQKQIQHLLDSI